MDEGSHNPPESIQRAVYNNYDFIIDIAAAQFFQNKTLILTVSRDLMLPTFSQI